MRFYRILLLLYPASFRAEYGDDMYRVVAERRRHTRGGMPSLLMWLDVVSDSVDNAARIQWDLLRQDLRYSLRSLSRLPGFALTAIVVMALGIGANTAMFSLTDRALLRPLPFDEPDKLVKLWENAPAYTRMEVSPPNYRDWKRMATVFDAMTAYHWRPVNVVGRGEPLRLSAVAVGAEFFPMLGVEPLIGRTTAADDVVEGAPAVIVLSYGVWQRVFGGERDAVGRQVRLDGRAHAVVGVMPESFYYPLRSTDLWFARRFTPEDFEDRDNNYLHVLAKLGPGISIDDARAEMDVITAQLERAYPVENASTRATVTSLHDDVSPQSRLLLTALFGAALCVLLIACTNLANLLLARTIERRRELALRSALGGGRERLVRQLLTESLLLSVVGGAVGVLLASLAAPLLAAFVPETLPIASTVAIDFRVLGFAVVLTALTGMGFGVFPAVRSHRGTDLDELRDGGRTASGGRRQRLRAGLVVAQVTACVVLLIVSGLLIRALWRVQAVDPGFVTDEVIALKTPLPLPAYETTSRRTQFYDRVLADVRALPGVVDAAYTSFLPMEMAGGIWPVTLEELPETASAPESASLRFVTPSFFSTMGIPLRLGRDVDDGDTFDAPFVAVVSESFARRYWPDRDPIGRRFQFAFYDRLVVGVVGDVRVRGLERRSEPQVYLPYRQVPDGGLVFYTPKELVVRAAVNETALADSVRRVLRSADPELPIADVRSLEAVVNAQTAPRSEQVRVLGVLVALSLVVAGVGIYGLLSFAVSRRRGEIGLRIALGASSTDVVRMVLGEGARLAVIGAALGIALAHLAGGAMESILAGVRPNDPATYGVAVGVTVAMTLAGSVVPAVRAARVAPTTTLHAE